MPWWGYGAAGMQLWFSPSLLSTPSMALGGQLLPQPPSSHSSSAAALAPMQQPGPNGGLPLAAAAGSRSGGRHAQDLELEVDAEVRAGGPPTWALSLACHGGAAEREFLPLVSACQEAGRLVGRGPSPLQALHEGLVRVQVYPVGISLADASIVGVTQRTVRAQALARSVAAASTGAVRWGRGGAGGARRGASTGRSTGRCRLAAPTLMRG